MLLEFRVNSREVSFLDVLMLLRRFVCGCVRSSSDTKMQYIEQCVTAHCMYLCELCMNVGGPFIVYLVKMYLTVM